MSQREQRWDKSFQDRIFAWPYRPPQEGNMFLQGKHVTADSEPILQAAVIQWGTLLLNFRVKWASYHT